MLEEVDSPINGKIKVIKGLAFGVYVQVEGLTQSGGILKSVWKKPLKKLKSQNLIVENCLILGLGGGTVAGLVREFWPKTKITGVDLDSIMIELGKKYLDLDQFKVKVITGDAYDFVKYSKLDIPNSEPDLILVDLYIGREYPKKFEDEKFIQCAKSILSSGGIIVFNRLYYGEKRSDAVKFGKNLEKIFAKVDVIYPEANVMYVCS